MSKRPVLERAQKRNEENIKISIQSCLPSDSNNCAIRILIRMVEATLEQQAEKFC